MASIFSSLASGLARIVKDTVKLRSMKKDDLQKLLRDNIEGHQKMEYILSIHSDKDMKNWMVDTVKPSLKNNQSKAKTTYEDYVKHLRGKASSEERTRPLGSLLKANAAYGKLLEEISKKIDKLFEQDAIDIFNVRMSHLAVLGIIRQSDMVLNFSMYLYSFMVRAASRSTVSIPKYREIYLIDKCDRVATVVSQLADKKGPYNFMQEVETIRRKNADMVLGASGRFDFEGFAVISNYTTSFLDNLASALSCLNIFGAALDTWDDYKLSKYERNKEIKEWLENHVALLRMDMDDMDKTGPEYNKILSIIKAYDDKIADYDKAIIAFEQED